MPARRLLMRKIREILRLKHERGLSHRAIAQACPSAWARFRCICRGRPNKGSAGRCRPSWTTRRSKPACSPVPRRCASGSGPTARTSTASSSATASRLQLLWEEYAQVHPNGYRYTQFCEIYRQWARRLRPSMRQVHRAGEKTFIDFSGKRPTLVDPRTGEVRRVELFVAVLGASSFTYAEATATQQLPDWVDAHTHMVEYFGARPPCGTPTSSRAPSPVPAATSRASIAPTRTSPPTTAPSSYPRGRGNQGTRLRSRGLYF